jgi:hypothetical protein
MASMLEVSNGLVRGPGMGHSINHAAEGKGGCRMLW